MKKFASQFIVLFMFTVTSTMQIENYQPVPHDCSTMLKADLGILRWASNYARQRIAFKDQMNLKSSRVSAVAGTCIGLASIPTIMWMLRARANQNSLLISAIAGLVLALSGGWLSGYFAASLIDKEQHNQLCQNKRTLVLACARQCNTPNSLWGKLFLPCTDFRRALLLAQQQDDRAPFEFELLRRGSELRLLMGLQDLDGDDAISTALREQTNNKILNFVRKREGKRLYDKNVLTNTFYRFQHWISTNTIIRLLASATPATNAARTMLEGLQRPADRTNV